MGVLSGLGPTWKQFEDLDAGDYLFEIAEPGDRGWLSEFADEEEPLAIITYVNWRLRVVKPEEFEGRTFFHRTMYDATSQKLAQARKPYDPKGFTRQFIGAVVGVVMQGEVTIPDEYLDKHDEPDPDAMIGVRFWGSIRLVQDKKDTSKSYANLTKAWQD